jgi:hypothetical protein
MKAEQLLTLVLAFVMAICLATAVWAKAPKMKMTTERSDSAEGL